MKRNLLTIPRPVMRLAKKLCFFMGGVFERKHVILHVNVTSHVLFVCYRQNSKKIVEEHSKAVIHP